MTTTILLTVGTSLLEPKTDCASKAERPPIPGTDLGATYPRIPKGEDFVARSNAARDNAAWATQISPPSNGDSSQSALGTLPHLSRSNGMEVVKELAKLSPGIVQTIRREENPRRIDKYDEDKSRKLELADDPFPAEISTLVLTLERLSEGPIRIGLLASDTEEGLWCAFAVRHILQRWASAGRLRPVEWIHEGTDVRTGFVHGVHRVPSLNILKPEDFVSTALPRIAEVVRKHADGQNPLILDVTGGFKSLLPYAGILGALFDNVTVQSLFELSAEHVIQPPLPIQLDLALWTTHRASVAALRELVDCTPGSEPSAWGALPPRIQGLYRPPKLDPGGTGAPKRAWATEPFLAGPLLEEISKRGDTLLNSGGISPYQTPTFLRDLFSDAQHAETLIDWINKAGDVWFGDLIPETVDHARGHAHRLCERARELIFPIKQILISDPDEYQRIFPDEMLLMLFGTLWMHDVGHASHRIRLQMPGETEQKERDISAFPSLVRDLHSFTAYERILSDSDHYRMPKDLTVLGVPFPQAVALGYRLHRGKLSIEGTTVANLKKSGARRCWTWVPDVEKGITDPRWDASWNDQDAPKFATAIQRLLDGSDVQAERAGNSDYRERRLALTWNELRIEWEWLKRLEKILPVTAVTKVWRRKGARWNHLVEYLPPRSEKTEELPVTRPEDAKDRPDDDMTALELTLYETLENLWSSEDPLFFEYLSTFDRVLFKASQASHFTEKHARVRSTSVKTKTTTFAKNNYRFEMAMEFTPETGEDRAKEIAEEVWSEYNAEVQDILAKKNIFLDGVRCRGSFEEFTVS